MRVWEGYQRGINLGGWFSQCDYSKDRFDNFIHKEDLANIASWGLDHVRLPIDYNLVQDEAGNYLEEGFAYIQNVVDWCGEYGLNMVLDLHKTYGFSFDPGEKQEGFFENEAYQERFYQLWETLAKRYGQYKDRVAFELLNEVTDQAYMPTWCKIIDKCIKRIRAIVPDVYILIGGYWNNSISSVPDLPMPADDHIIYNFHSYDPVLFTHQGAYWVESMPTDFRFDFDQSLNAYMEASKNFFGDLFGHYPDFERPEDIFDVRFFEAMFAPAIMVAEERNVPLYCGEYGVINLASPEDTVKWYREINKMFVRHGIGRAAWSYKEMDFGLIDEHMAGVIEELKQYL